MPSRDYVPVPLPKGLRQPKLRVVHPAAEHPHDADSGKLSGTNERLNFITHGIGFGLSVVATVLLWWTAAAQADPVLTIACTAYGLTMMAVYGFSTLSHGDFSQERRHFFRTLDQVSIFLFMAAASSPFLVAFARNPWGVFLLGTTWLLALTGVAVKLFITRKGIVPVWYYLLVGWFPGLSLITIAASLGTGGLALLIASAVGFTTGTWFLVNDHKAHWYHAVWHVMVIGSTALQYLSVLLFVVP